MNGEVKRVTAAATSSMGAPGTTTVSSTPVVVGVVSGHPGAGAAGTELVEKIESDGTVILSAHEPPPKRVRSDPDSSFDTD